MDTDSEPRPAAAPRPDLSRLPIDPDALWPESGLGYGAPGQSRADQHGARRREQVSPRARHRPDRTLPRLTRDEIVDAAIAIADAEGAGALSMRRIAQVLQAGTMSLYWHVTSKEHLLELMRDMLVAEIEVPAPSGDWHSDLRELALSTRRMLRRHRWLMEFAGGRPPLGPNTLLGLERSLAIIAGLGPGPEGAFDILTAVNTYVSGTVLREAREMRTQQAERELERSSDQVTLERKRRAWRDRLAATGLFPNLIGFLDARIDPDALETMDQRFEFGLDSLLDGMAARIGRGAAPREGGSI